VSFFKYDEKGRLISEGYDNSDGTFGKHYYKYDHFGNLIQQEDIYNFGKETSKSTLEFEYDERNNNWIRKTRKYISDTTKMTDVSISLTERTIVYK